MDKNDVLIHKAVTGSSFLNGGELNAKQRDTFLMYVRKFTKLIPLCRTEIMENPKLEIPKLHIGEPITKGLVDNNLLSETGTPLFNSISLDTKELFSYYNITRRAVRRNVSLTRIVEQVTQAMMMQIATDLENAFINGDETLGAGTPINDLLRVNNGLDILSNSGNIYDHSGDFISKTVFAKMIRMMPESYSDDPGLRFFLPRALQVDWTDLNSERIDAIGERAFKGNVEAPFGVPIVSVPLLPSRKAVAVTVATAGHILGTVAGPFNIVTGTNDTLIVNLGAGNKTCTLPQGVWTAQEIAAYLKATAGLSTLIVQDDGFGHIFLQHPTSGVAATLTIAAANGWATLGVAVAAYAGTDAGSAGSLNDGCIILLANPMNFIWGNYDKTEIYTEWNKDYARWETVVINETDYAIESADKVVKAINVRRRPF
jgi:hypothetical protein